MLHIGACLGLSTLLQIHESLGSTKVNINLPDVDGITPLLAAARSGESECVVYLISIGANVNAIDREKNSAMHFALKQNNLSLVGILINNGYDWKLLQTSKGRVDRSLWSESSKEVRRMIEYFIGQCEELMNREWWNVQISHNLDKTGSIGNGKAYLDGRTSVLGKESQMYDMKEVGIDDGQEMIIEGSKSIGKLHWRSRSTFSDVAEKTKT
jgi:hypothetical protein